MSAGLLVRSGRESGRDGIEACLGRRPKGASRKIDHMDSPKQGRAAPPVGVADEALGEEVVGFVGELQGKLGQPVRLLQRQVEDRPAAHTHTHSTAPPSSRVVLLFVRDGHIVPVRGDEWWLVCDAGGAYWSVLAGSCRHASSISVIPRLQMSFRRRNPSRCTEARQNIVIGDSPGSSASTKEAQGIEAVALPPPAPPRHAAGGGRWG
jgi:hypothetical protein